MRGTERKRFYVVRSAAQLDEKSSASVVRRGFGHRGVSGWPGERNNGQLSGFRWLVVCGEGLGRGGTPVSGRPDPPRI